MPEKKRWGVLITLNDDSIPEEALESLASLLDMDKIDYHCIEITEVYE